MSPTFQPPRRALRLLDWALPEDAREHIAGDLQELYRRQFIAHGEAHARRWYWRQSLSFAARFSWERLRTVGRAADEKPAREGASSRPSWIDVKLGVRMLAKHPALTLIGGFAIMVSIGIGAAWFEFANDYIAPPLPLEEGDRIVGIQSWDAAASEVDGRAVHDFAAWRGEVRTIEDLGAFRSLERNLISSDGRAETVRIAEMTAAAFRVARVQPLLGRGLLEDDERPGAEPVVVLGHGVWVARFGGSRDVVGETVRIGSVTARIVGVMPEGFAWPISHRMWMPLSLNPAVHARRTGPWISVVGRLAPGVSLSDARAELGVIGARLARQFPETNEHLRPRVKPYVESLSDDIGREVLYINAVFIMVLIVACTNVATLVFARAATREREIAVRNALGASRGRIIMQLFVESLVLASVAAAVGLLLTAAGLKWGMRLFWAVQDGNPPFWWDSGLAPATVLYVGLLTVLGAAVTGILPALKVTGRDVAARLRQATAGGAGIRFGGMWTAIIVVQVAITVTFLAAASEEGRSAFREIGSGVEVGAERFLSAQVMMDYDVPAGADAQAYDSAFAAGLARARERLRQQLLAEPGVTAVTYASQLPGMSHYVDYFEIDGQAAIPAPEGGHMLRSATVDDAFFQAFDVAMLAGRDFDRADVESGRRVAIVNQTFVETVLGGRNPIGRRVRETSPAGASANPWYEIVGVVKDLGMNTSDPREGAGVYRPFPPTLPLSAYVAVRAGQDPSTLVPRLRTIVADVDPTLRIKNATPLADVARSERNGALALLALLGALVLGAFLLSTAGVYSLMALTVSQRTREIGIRAALGADRGQILASIFGRALGQLALGIGLGALVVLLAGLTSYGSDTRETLLTALAVAGLMMLVGLGACVVPARRGLRIQPTEALRGEG